MNPTDLKEVIESLRKELAEQPNSADIHCNLGIALAESGDLNSAIKCYQDAVNIESRHIPAYTNLGSIYRSLGKTEEALVVFEKIIELDSNEVSAYVNLGSLYKEKGDLNGAETNYQKAVKLLPNDCNAYFNLGNALRYEGDIKVAIQCYREATAIKSDFVAAHYYLANALKEAKRIEESADSYSQVIALLRSPLGHNTNGVHMFRMSVAHKAECLYELGESDTLRKFITDSAKIDQANIRLATLSAFASHQYEVKDLYPFCRDPLSMIKIDNISTSFTDFEKFKTKLITYLNGIPQVWEPSNATTKQGFQTEDQLFNLQNDMLKQLEEIIWQKINQYYSEFKSLPSTFTSKWPAQRKMKSWYVRLVQGGHQDAHMHNLGWLSGVVYLKTIVSPIKEEGSIEFGLHGYDYKIINENLPSTQHQPNDGDIVLFPSSLFHRTIPIRQNTDRSVIAFDLMPDS